MNRRMMIAAVVVTAHMAVAAPATAHATPTRVNVPILIHSDHNSALQATVWQWTGDGHRTARVELTNSPKHRLMSHKRVTVTYRCGAGQWRKKRGVDAVTVKLPSKGRCQVIGTGKWSTTPWSKAKSRRTDVLTVR